ncbi:iron-containing redox enzyme family protein [Streptomyces sp. 8N706]|uniref:iron-containing redox enzyme family protein n=1 Tax=Streptomyces sp. 8N706 TaxID=3457416 RepID=UPI003FD4E8FE
MPEGSGSRSVFVRASDPEASFPGARFLEEVRTELRRLAGDAPPPVEELREQASAWADEERRRHRELFARAGSDAARAVLVRRAVLGCAPLAVVSGAWLQWLSGPANADDPAALRILSLYASDLGVGHPRASRGSAYLSLLRHLQLAANAAPPARLGSEPRIGDGAFYIPGLLLAMSRRPDDFTPEILGADLCLRTVGLLPALAAVRETLPAATDWTAVDPGSARQEGEPSGAELCRAAVRELPAAAHDGTPDRLLLGFAWALAALRRWSVVLYDELGASRDPAYEMGELMRLRAREGAVYHHGFELGGRPLSAWLQECRTDPAPLLKALAGSRLVKPGRSQTSALVGSLVGEDGPMFRVFAPEDLAVIRRWIDSLPAAPSPRSSAEDASVPPPASAAGDGAASPARPVMPSLTLPGLAAAPVSEGHAPADLREAYHRLQTRTDTPALRRWARDYVHGWLARSGHGADRSELPLPERWGPEGLRPWLVEQHDRHSHEFEESSGAPVPSREALIDSTVQLAPLTLIDGSWLQGFTDYEHASSEIGFSLFETYWDELGNGEARLNHPLIYREVLAEMDVELPPTGSREFASWPGFRDSSFELPVYWLCIGRFPQTFLPEVLGLNLAMELSGVGGTYRRAHIALKTHGFSTRFVDIHNTIDNVSTGHSAWAADAVDTYLTTVPTAQGASARDEAWKRVRTGYRSLNPPAGFRARRAGRRARLAGSARRSEGAR